MVEQFTTAAEAVGAEVKRFPTLNEAVAAIRSRAGGRAVATSALPPPVRSALDGLDCVPAGALHTAEIGISFAQAGIARTGSLLLALSDPAGRSATALPPVHLVILDAATIVADLSALGGTLGALLSSPGSAYLSLITGPSRTADIERVLTIGVHGPKELHILIVEEN
ncbi:lactate utilization protein [Geobacter sp.]|uniref:LutC/YkgG family protein n=1 Tax=Geobacter sp. TaxID=46610 RepID=UPI0026271223|nr:lactate utilization protein [Geobacter sp.]